MIRSLLSCVLLASFAGVVACSSEEGGGGPDDQGDASAATGGRASGGRASGGTSSGGRASGGMSSGGRASGGTSSGGTSSGGTSSGGTSSGGTSSGGTSSGGTSSGGASSSGGSASTGGTSSGGTSSGGASSSGGSASTGGAGGGISDSGAGGAGSLDSGTDASTACNTLASGPVVTDSADPGGEPVMTGGTVEDGTYHMTSYVQYGESNPTIKTRTGAIRVSGTTFDLFLEEDGEGPLRASGTFTVAGNVMTVVFTCPDGAGSLALVYTASTGTFQYYLQGNHDVSVFAKQ